MATSTPPPTEAGQLRRQDTVWGWARNGHSPAARLLGGGNNAHSLAARLLRGSNSANKGRGGGIGSAEKRGFQQQRQQRELPTTCVCGISPTGR